MTSTLAPPGPGRVNPEAGVRRRTVARKGRDGAGPLWLAGFGLVAWGFAVSGVEPSRMGNLGLSSVLGWQFALAVVAVAGSVAWSLAARRPRPTVAVLALLVVVFATAPVVEPIARGPTTWVHAGFINYIAQHGRVLPGYDARFSWPGFFSLGAVLDAVTGRHDPTVFLRWAPPAFEFAYLAPLRVIARATLGPGRAGWLGTALFYATNWVDQDYFSPQALNMLFFLVVVASVLAFWRPRAGEGPPGPSRVSRWWRGLGRVDGLLGPRRQIGLQVLLLTICAACVASHQFTPYALVLALAACVATRRLPGLELPAILGVMAVGWLSFATASFWSHHLSLLFGGTGSIGAAVGQNVSARVVGAPSHRLVVDLRLVFGAALIVVAAAGALRRKGAGRSLEALAAVPFALLGAGTYGGEALIRCFLFALPFLSLLAASLLVRLVEVPGEAIRLSRTSIALLGAVLTGCSFLLMLVRGGNDAYEAFTPTERAAVLSVYAAARPGQRLAATTPPTDQLPWRDEGLGTWTFIDPTNADSASAVAASLLGQRADWVILTRNEERWGELVAGLPAGWQDEVAADLAKAGYAVSGRWPTAEVLRRTG